MIKFCIQIILLVSLRECVLLRLPQSTGSATAFPNQKHAVDREYHLNFCFDQVEESELFHIDDDVVVAYTQKIVLSVVHNVTTSYFTCVVAYMAKI
mmetsp:Transcript_6125/g.13243  ORF Transcript_6125/g.13243 Transcript_6125/m.13243 type:complete len:96 (-) Transcript_6125:124-411(-)